MNAALSRKLHGICRLALIAAALLLFFKMISPRMVAMSPALTRYGEVQSLYGLHSASLYYTDQATLADTQAQVRRALVASGHMESAATP